VIASIGRAEHVELSPDNRLLAVAGFGVDKVFLFSIEIDLVSRSPRVHLGGCLSLRSPSIAAPHGLCNRAADACIFKIPSDVGETRGIDIAPRAVVSGKGTLFARVKNPGSADSCRLTENSFRVLICNNYWNFVSSHLVYLDRSVRVESQEILSSERLRIPDGVCMSPDKTWFAISNHANGEVLVYRAAANLGTSSEPAAVLGGMVCPHGLRFITDDTLIVADAACPYLHVYRRDGEEWTGEQSKPSQSIRVLSDQQFFDGRTAAGEGGVKGLEVDRSGRLLITTKQLDPLGFYDLAELVRDSDELPEDLYAEFSRQRDDSLHRWHSATLVRSWTIRQRVGQALRQRWEYSRELGRKARTKARVLSLEVRNLFSQDRMLDSRGPTVSLTTHSYRINRVHCAIESIGKGTLKPSRIILWLTDEDLLANLPAALQRLQARGLEIQLADEFGPHSKYFPYLESTDDFDRPLVTADDDALYPPDWLQDLVHAHAALPGHIHCHHVRRMGVTESELTPYNEWPFCEDDRASHLNFIMGVGGVIYPPAFLASLKRAGRTFMECCPTNDDMWLTVNAVRAGIKVRQVRREGLRPVPVPGTQGRSLFHINMLQGANQVQLRRTFDRNDLAILRAQMGDQLPTLGHA
jgi:hypothetical protein